MYTCDARYRIDQSGSQRTCGVNGQWQGQPPKCGKLQVDVLESGWENIHSKVMSSFPETV